MLRTTIQYIQIPFCWAYNLTPIEKFTFLLLIVGAVQAWAFVQSERASLTLSATQFSAGLAAGKPFMITFEVKNGGKSTAQIDKFQPVTYFAFGNKRLPPMPQYGQSAEVAMSQILPGGNNRIVLRVREPIKNELLILTKDVADGIANGTIGLYLFGRVVYKDDYSRVFGTHVLGYCFWYDPNTTDSIRFPSCDEPAYTYAY